MGVEAERLEFGVLPYVFQFRLYGHEVLHGAGVHVAEYVGEEHEGGFCLFGAGDDEGIEGVEGVEEEVGVDLRLVEGEFGLVLLGLDFLLRQHLLEELEGQFDGQRESGDHEEEEPYCLCPDVHAGFQLLGVVDGAFGCGEICEHDGGSYEQRHQYSYLRVFSLHEHLRDVCPAVGEVEQVDIGHEGCEEGRVRHTLPADPKAE